MFGSMPIDVLALLIPIPVLHQADGRGLKWYFYLSICTLIVKCRIAESFIQKLYKMCANSVKNYLKKQYWRLANGSDDVLFLKLLFLNKININDGFSI